MKKLTQTIFKQSFDGWRIGTTYRLADGTVWRIASEAKTWENANAHYDREPKGKKLNEPRATIWQKKDGRCYLHIQQRGQKRHVVMVESAAPVSNN